MNFNEMITKKLIKLSLLIVINTLSAQDLPEIVSQTPEAAALSKYNEFPVGTFTGIPEINIPLHTISSGDISFPINLNYHAGGFKVSEESGWVGLGWTLSVNSVITRAVNGVDDFNGSMADGTTAYHALSNPKIVDITLGSVYPNTGVEMVVSEDGLVGPFGSPGSNGFMGHYMTFAYSRFRSNIANVDNEQVDYNSYRGSSFDWEPDIYSLNIPGHNGKFVMDQEQNVYFFEKKDIEVGRTDNGWTIRTNNGFQYYFEAKETSTNFYGRELNGSWYLTKIISPNKREMNFIYENAGNESIQYSYSEYADVNPSSSAYSVNRNPISTLHFTKKYLVKIEFDEGSVEFVRDNNLREDLKNGESLKYMRIFDLNGQLIKEFEFLTSYFNSNSTKKGFLKDFSEEEYSYYTKRLKLDEIIERKGTEYQKYRFNYSSVNLPNKDSFSQDYWGYYNGQSNSSLIPTFKGELTFKSRYRGEGNRVCGDIDNSLDYTVYRVYNGSNRNSDIQYIGANILKEITYPTGGKTTFEFEANEFGNLADIEDEYTYQSYSQHVKVNSYTNQQNIKYYSTDFPADFPSDAVEIYDPQIELVVYSTGSPVQIPFNMTAEFKSQSGYEKQYRFSDILSAENNYNYSERLQIPEEYLTGMVSHPFSLDIIMPEISSNQTAIFTFKCNLKRKNPISKKYTGGLRVKTITHFNGIDHTNDIIKSYVYDYTETNSEGVVEDKTYGILKTPVKYHYLFWNDQSCQSYFRFTSSNTYNLSPAQNSHIGYSKVIEKIGENSENGRNVYKYANYVNEFHQGDERPPGVPNTFSKRYDGKLTEKIVYNIEGDLVFKEIYQHQIKKENVIKGIFQDHYKEPFIAGDGFYGKGGMHYYPIFSRWEPKISQKTLNIYDNDTIKVITQYDYNNENLLPSSVTTSNSAGKVLLTKNYYPVDVTSTSSLSGGNLTTEEYNAIKRLKKGDLYHIAEPVQVETWQDGKKLSTQRTTYKDWGGNLVLPKGVFTSKDTTSLKLRIQYHQYDGYGNPLELSIVNGPHITYLWGYNGQYPVAKVENATYADVVATGVNLSVLQNTSNTESAKITELNKIRNHAGMVNAQVTTYTYKPLIGMSTITDPRGEKTTYTYDTFNRLQFIKDETSKLLEEYKYHYKN